MADPVYVLVYVYVYVYVYVLVLCTRFVEFAFAARNRNNFLTSAKLEQAQLCTRFVEFAFAARNRNNFLTSAKLEQAQLCTRFVVILPPRSPRLELLGRCCCRLVRQHLG